MPQHLIDTGIKRGDEFDVNQYFTVLNHISMQDGYLLDYVYISESLGGSPLLYTRLESQDPYDSMEDVPENTLNTTATSFIWTGMLCITTPRSPAIVTRSRPSSRISVMEVLAMLLIFQAKSKLAL